LPLNIPVDDIENYIANKSLYPQLIPTTPRELAIEQALAKRIMRQIVQDMAIQWVGVQTVILTGGVLAGVQNQAQAVGMLLDGLQPEGAQRCLLDHHQSLLAIGGALSVHEQEDYRLGRALLNEVLVPTGSVISLPLGKERLKATAAVEVGLLTNQSVQIRPGELIQVPLGATEWGHVNMTYPGLFRQHHQAEAFAISGGQVGLVIDTRSRPIEIPAGDNERLSKLLFWDKQLNAHQQVAPIGGTNA
jgi:hypothetical protein